MAHQYDATILDIIPADRWVAFYDGGIERQVIAFAVLVGSYVVPLVLNEDGEGVPAQDFNGFLRCHRYAG